MAYSVAKDLVVLGNDIADATGVTNLTLNSGGNVTVAGDLKITGNDIQASDGTAAITLTASSGNVAVTGDLTVTGNDIKDASAATCLTFSSGAVSTGAALTTGGNFIVNSSSTTKFGGVEYTWPASDAASSGYVLKSNSLGTLSWGADDSGGITTSRQTGTSFPAAAGYFYLCDISASCEVTLPTPAAGNRIIFKAGGSVSSSVKVSLKSAAAADKIDGAAHNSSPLEALVTPYAAVELVACAGDGLGTIEWFIV